ncbi:hypothetical protein ABBQ32_013237 [Trebouxia sp. C0010 RCD-2024]
MAQPDPGTVSCSCVTNFSGFYRVPHTAGKELKALPTTQPTFRATGRARDQRDVYCHSLTGQHAHIQHVGPDISKLHPALQQQWDHAANSHLGNIVNKPHSNKKVRGKCNHCPDGHLHNWSARVTDKTRGSGCLQCSGYQVCKHNSLATKAPLVAAQWDHQANDGTPDDAVAQSNHMASWYCKLCGCKWEATPNARVRKKKSGCPQCGDAAKTKKRTKHSSYAEFDHLLLAEWDHKRNAARKHYPDKVRLKSGKQIFWLCAKCPAGQEHSWSAAAYQCTGCQKTGCPFCAGRAACVCNSLQASPYPDTAAEWDYSKNKGLPSDYPTCSTHLAWWSSPQRASWQQTIESCTSRPCQKASRLRR